MSRVSYVDVVMPELVRAFRWDALSPPKGFVQTVANSH
jgi:hypothetical protein